LGKQVRVKKGKLRGGEMQIESEALVSKTLLHRAVLQVHFGDSPSLDHESTRKASWLGKQVRVKTGTPLKLT